MFSLLRQYGSLYYICDGRKKVKVIYFEWRVPETGFEWVPDEAPPTSSLYRERQNEAEPREFLIERGTKYRIYLELPLFRFSVKWSGSALR